MIDCNCASFYFLRERMEKVFERKTGQSENSVASNKPMHTVLLI